MFLLFCDNFFETKAEKRNFVLLVFLVELKTRKIAFWDFLTFKVGTTELSSGALINRAIYGEVDNLIQSAVTKWPELFKIRKKSEKNCLPNCPLNCPQNCPQSWPWTCPQNCPKKLFQNCPQNCPPRSSPRLFPKLFSKLSQNCPQNCPHNCFQNYL